MTRNKKSIVVSFVVGTGFFVTSIICSPYFFIPCALGYGHSFVTYCRSRRAPQRIQPVVVNEDSPPLPSSAPSVTEEESHVAPREQPAPQSYRSTLNDTKDPPGNPAAQNEGQPVTSPNPSSKSPRRVTWVFDRVGIVIEPSAPVPPGSIQYDAPIERVTIKIKQIGPRR